MCSTFPFVAKGVAWNSCDSPSKGLQTISACQVSNSQPNLGYMTERPALQLMLHFVLYTLKIAEQIYNFTKRAVSTRSPHLCFTHRRSNQVPEAIGRSNAPSSSFLFFFVLFSTRPFFSFADKTSVYVSMCVSIHSASVTKLVLFNKNDIKCHNT